MKNMTFEIYVKGILVEEMDNYDEAYHSVLKAFDHFRPLPVKLVTVVK